MKKSRDDDSGRIWIKDDVIHHESTWCGTWSMPIAELRVFGEMTNQLGPFGEDYLFCFVHKTDEGIGWLRASFYGEGRDAFLTALGEQLSTQFELTLAGSCDFKSNILWPPQLADSPMFDFINDKPSSPLQWLKWLIGCGSNTQYLTQDVREFIKH